MEFRDLKTQYAYRKDEIDAQIAQVLTSGIFIGGPKVTELEEALAEYVGVKHCISCANGTDALQLALMAWNIGPGDAVFVPDFTFFSTAEVVSLVGATPVFVDVCEDTFNMDPVKLEIAIRKTKAEKKLTAKVIIPVDLFGLPADHDAIRKIANDHELLVLEDGAQGFGGRIGDRKACSFGDISTTSFFPAKPLGCYGDGGAIFTDNDEWAALLRSYKVHGKGEDKYDNVRIGLNSRLDAIQAGVLLGKLPSFDPKELVGCNSGAEKYTQQLRELVKTPIVPEGMYSSWAQYTIRLASKEQRDSLQAGLKTHGIPSMVYYQKPLHRQGAFSELRVPDTDLEVTCKLCDTVLSLPMHPFISEEDIRSVVTVIRAYI